MASSKEYLEFILGQLSELSDITHRSMMGEFIIYYKGKIAAEICDDRFLVKNVKSAVEYVGNPKYEFPYEGAKKPLILVEEVDSKEYLTGLFEAVVDELPTPKPRKKKVK